MRPEIDRIQAALDRVAEVERQYKLDREAAREELKQATRALADIATHSERVQAVVWAAQHTIAPKNDLAWVIFGKEHQEFHLRKLVKGTHRQCPKCGNQFNAGNRFEQVTFCDPCEATMRVERQHSYNESERRRRANVAARVKRIAELKAQTTLSDADAREFAALMVAQVDGPVSQIADFICEGENRA